MKNLIYTILALFGASNAMHAQHDHSQNAPLNPELCGEHHMRAQLYLENASFRAQDSIDQINLQANYEDYLSQWSADDRSTYTVPVVVHVVHLNGAENISNDQINNAIENLNADFNMLNSDLGNTVSNFQSITGNASVEFKLATKDPNGNCHSGITKTISNTTYDTGMSNGGHPIVDAVAAEHGVWPQNKYMSVFVCIDPNGSAGYTFRPSNFFSPNQMYGGIFMRSDYMGSTGTSSQGNKHTLGHEAGHWLNLAHLWGSTNNPGISSSCGTDDGVADTPNTVGWTSCNLSGTTCGSLDNVQNIMEYSYCSTMFTQGQAARIQAALQDNTAGRSNLSSANNLMAAGVDVVNNNICEAKFTTSTRIICAGNSVEFTDVSYHNVTGRNWIFAGGFPANSTDSVTNITYNAAGEYNVTLEVYNAISNVTTIENNIIKVMSNPGVGIPYVEGFENVSNFPDNLNFSVDNPNGDYTWEVSSAAASSGSKSLVLKNHSVNADDDDKLVSGSIDLSVLDPADDFIMSFKYAYHKQNASNDEWLKIYVSKDCGDSWSLRKLIHGNVLSDQVQSSYYTPVSEDWETVVITNISDLYYVPNFRYRFEFESDGGNNIYIDDINLSSPVFTSVNETKAEQSISLFPNPSEHLTQLNLNGFEDEVLSIALYDVTGHKIRNIYSGLVGASTVLNIETGQLSKGLYIIKIDGNSSHEVLKLIKE